MRDVTTHPAEPTLREQAILLTKRLDRIAAAAATLRALSFDIRHDVPPAPMAPLLDNLDRDIVLASHELEELRARTARDVASLR